MIYVLDNVGSRSPINLPSVVWTEWINRAVTAEELQNLAASEDQGLAKTNGRDLALAD